ncbi:MAG TPA: DeoR/GlpR family DNA-binding transcription regulator [Devosia sp.]|nr:DeoR/GlpR family DNA-binding transcription regulator [Devosia sp.]
MNDLSPRQADIMALARQHGRVDVDGLAAQFAVAPQTIRKDLNDLCDRRLLNRQHGGATYPSGVVNFAYEARRLLAADGKRAIGERAAGLIPDQSSVILNIGTTTEQVATALRRHAGLMVVTNNINVANILREVPSAEVVIAGGVVRHEDGGVVGETAVDFIRQFRVDYAVIGTSAIGPDGTLLDYDLREVKVAQAIMETARETILVADFMKFERRAPVRIGHLEQIDVLVTDREPPDEIAGICAEHGVRIEIAGGGQAETER